MRELTRGRDGAGASMAMRVESRVDQDSKEIGDGVSGQGDYEARVDAREGRCEKG